jgi:hypothetical protein
VGRYGWWFCEKNKAGVRLRIGNGCEDSMDVRKDGSGHGARWIDALFPQSFTSDLWLGMKISHGVKYVRIDFNTM